MFGSFFEFLSSPRVLEFSKRFSSYFLHAGALKFLLVQVSAKNAPMPCDPQKLMFVHVFFMFFQCLLRRRARGEEAKISKKSKKKQAMKATKKSSKSIKIHLFRLPHRSAQKGCQNDPPEPPRGAVSEAF